MITSFLNMLCLSVWIFAPLSSAALEEDRGRGPCRVSQDKILKSYFDAHPHRTGNDIPAYRRSLENFYKIAGVKEQTEKEGTHVHGTVCEGSEGH
jgi:hypothetical protein